MKEVCFDRSARNRLLFLGFLLVAGLCSAQRAPAPYGPVPSERQLRWHETEQYGLIHFTPTTFENKEWGYGDADPALFNPSQFDADQIVSAAKAGGLRGIVLVAKHHDGFCLWPTETTPYNISKSPFRGGKGDLVREVEQACRRHGLHFGVYCSPWDRNHPLYGQPAYVDVYRRQLRELYTRYGELFMSWHDGANGGDGYYGGAREKRTIDNTTYYGWDTTWTMTRKLQPGANLFSDVGWDVRWVGNEKGIAAETHWHTFTPRPPEGASAAVPGQSNYPESPGGTRNGKFWMPAECDVPLRKGWFYHPEEEGQVKSPDALYSLYLQSVGRGAGLDLGLAPDRRGQLADADVAALRGLGERLRKTFAVNLMQGASLRPSNVRGGQKGPFGPENLRDDDQYSYWATDDGTTRPTLEITWPRPVRFSLIRLRENIKLGQRLERVWVESWQDGRWQPLAEATSVGANRLIRLPQPITATRLRLRFEAPVCVALSDVGFFAESDPVR